jgi:hypothetical protein
MDSFYRNRRDLPIFMVIKGDTKLSAGKWHSFGYSDSTN